VIASDHGEAFREHGFEGHARTCTAISPRFPCDRALFQSPGIVEQGRELRHLADAVDLLGFRLPGRMKSLMLLIQHAAAQAEARGARPRPIYSQLDQR
jgi:hypothetical protein